VIWAGLVLSNPVETYRQPDLQNIHNIILWNICCLRAGPWNYVARALDSLALQISPIWTRVVCLDHGS
jgi:hypothetical protein